jgi:hypothetical protein
MAPILLGLAQLAPSLIKYFSGNDMAASVAAQVVGIAQTVTGTAAPDAALTALQADPAKALEFQQKVLEADTLLTAALLADVQNARAMQVAALGQDDIFSKRFVYYFASVWSAFSMLYFCAVTFAPLPAAGQRVADTILGVLITSVVGVMFAYFYGTTKNSMEKTRMLAQSVPAK